MDTSSKILVEQDKSIVTITLNQPDKHNAFDDKLIRELLAQLKEIALSPQVRIVILQAKGKSFSAGADLNWMQRMVNYTEQQNVVDALQLSDLMENLYQLPQITLALIQGPTYGGGVGLVACCDIAIGCKQAKFCFSEVKLGLIPAVISPYVIAAIGARATRRYFFSAETFSAQQALQLGLISEIVDIGNLQEHGRALAQTILNNAPQALLSSKQLITKYSHSKMNPDLKQALARLIAQIRVSEEGQTGIRAFLAKKKPIWKTNKE